MGDQHRCNIGKQPVLKYFLLLTVAPLALVSPANAQNGSTAAVSVESGAETASGRCGIVG